MTAQLVLIIALALAFDYINGFHDAANSIATVVSTRVLSPRLAVAWAAFFNFVAFLVFSTHVAGNIAEGGPPPSSSHALLGGIAGAAVVKAGFGSLDAAFFKKTALFIVLSPLIGGAL